MQRWTTMWGIWWRSCVWGLGSGAVLGSVWGMIVGVVGSGHASLSVGWGVIGAVLGSVFGAVLGLGLGGINGFVLSLVTSIAWVPLTHPHRYRWGMGMLSVSVTALCFFLIGVLELYPLPDPRTGMHTDPDIRRANLFQYVIGPAPLALLGAAWASHHVAGWHIRTMHRGTPLRAHRPMDV